MKNQNNNSKVNKEEEVKESKEESLENLPLDKISDPIQRKKEEIRRKRLEEDQELESFIKEEELRKGKIEKIESFVKSKGVKDLFPQVDSPVGLIKEMIEILGCQDQVKEFFFSSLKDSPSGRGRGNERELSSRDVLLYKVYRMENPSQGDGVIGKNLLPNLVEGFLPLSYSKSKNIRMGVHDDKLSQDDKEVLRSINGMDDLGINQSPIEKGLFQKLINS